MDYQKLILRIKCPEIRECPFREPISCTKCRDAVGEDSIFAIKELLSRVEELEAKNKRLEVARENANAACAKWEGLYKAEVTKRETLEKMVKEYQEVIIPGYINIAEKSGGMPMPEPPKAEEGMRMERITSNRPWEEAQYDLANEKGYSKIWLRLNMIEDILGDDYDLDRLQDLVKADREGRCVIFRKGYGIVSEYEMDEEGFITRTATGVVTREEYDRVLKGDANG